MEPGGCSQAQVRSGDPQAVYRWASSQATVALSSGVLGRFVRRQYLADTENNTSMFEILKEIKENNWKQEQETF